jgi:dienelactone hydrolase
MDEFHRLAAAVAQAQAKLSARDTARRVADEAYQAAAKELYAAQQALQGFVHGAVADTRKTLVPPPRDPVADLPG